MRAFGSGLVWVSTLAAVLCGCARGDFATVTIDYDAARESDVLRPGVTSRQRVVAAFKEFTSAHGYKCRAHVKRVEEFTCKGPRDMHVTFAPKLNEREFIARFNWIEMDGRTSGEFGKHTADFAQAMRAAVGEADVRLVKGNPEDADTSRSETPQPGPDGASRRESP